jgi:hypothetical protein
MYLYYVLFTLINIYGIDCQKKVVVEEGRGQVRFVFETELYICLYY